MRSGPRIEALLIAAAAMASCESGPPPGPAVQSLALVAPHQSEPAFEPHLSIDPLNADHIVVAAQYGIGYNRGGLGIWTWQTRDAGHTWSGSDMPLPAAGAGLAADAVTAFGPDGLAHLLFLFADTAGKRFDGGAALATAGHGFAGFGPGRIVARGGLTMVGAAVDKGWLAVDGSERSERRGSLYLTWHLNRPDFEARTVESTFWMASSRNGGRSFSEPLRVAEAFSGQVGVRADGTVHVIYGDRSGRWIAHAASSNGGATFGVADTVVALGGGFAFDVPHLLVTPSGPLLVCWAETSAADSLRYTTRCTRSESGTVWEPPLAVAPDLPDESSLTYPVTAASRDGIWLLAYRSDGDTTTVQLYRSTDAGRSFVLAHELARRPFGGNRFCAGAGSACRRAPADSVFFPGDYVGLAATAGRVVAAYVLPEGDAPGGRATVFVSLIRP